MGDEVWLADQNALRGQYKLARVISVNADKKGIVRDVMVRTFHCYLVSIVKPSRAETTKNVKPMRKLSDKIPATILLKWEVLSSFWRLSENIYSSLLK